jgi:hypothetical protein
MRALVTVLSLTPGARAIALSLIPFPQVLRLLGDPQVDRHLDAINDDRVERYDRRGSNSLRPCPPLQKIRTALRTGGRFV